MNSKTGRITAYEVRNVIRGKTAEHQLTAASTVGSKKLPCQVVSGILLDRHLFDLIYLFSVMTPTKGLPRQCGGMDRTSGMGR